jgi:hypothetical protein
MGSLILLLLVIDRRAKVVARAKVWQERERLLAQRRQANDAERAEWEQRRLALHLSLYRQNQEITAELDRLRRESKNRSSQNEAEQIQSRELVERVRAESAWVQSAQYELARIVDEATTRGQQTDAQHKELARVDAELAELEKTLLDLQAARQREQETYSFIPYAGRLGDTRPPIYVECQDARLLFHPGGPCVQPSEITSGRLRAEIERQAAHGPPNGPAGAKPYVLFVVRPDGIVTYYRALAALKNVSVDYGYELVEKDWKLDFSSTPRPGSQLASGATNRGAERSGWPQGALSETARRVVAHDGTNQVGPSLGPHAMFSPSGSGSDANSDSGALMGGHPESGPEPVTSLVPQHGAGSQGWPQGALSETARSVVAGHSSNQVGPSLGQQGMLSPSGPGSGPNADSAAPMGGFLASGSGPVTGPVPQLGPQFGGPMVAQGGGSRDQALTPSGGFLQGLDRGSTSGQTGVPSTLPASASPQQAPNQAGNVPESLSSARPASVPVGMSRATKGSGSEDGTANSAGQAGSSPWHQTAHGSSGETAGLSGEQSGSENSGRRSSSRQDRPLLIDDGREFTITIECAADYLTLVPPGLRIAVQSQQSGLSLEDRLRNGVRQTIARRQAMVLPGDSPYRPTIRFIVLPAGLRTYYRAYPALEALRVPMRREDRPVDRRQSIETFRPFPAEP